MTDDVENQQDETAPEEPKGPMGGERLAEARREQQISVHEIAKELHLDEPKVRALERNEFDLLGAPVFAKGHLKTYAQLVHVDLADVMSDYYQLTRSMTVPPVISSRPKVRHELSPGPWIAALVVIIAIASVYWWISRPADPESQADESPIVEDSMIVVPQDAEADTVTTPPATTDAAVIEPPVQEPVACWTEISDARGRRLLFDLGKDGRTVELSGAEPFNVLFGNPGNVSLRVNGQDYALPATSRPDRPMRLTISGS
jgi:cytoskeletal protein RodZ